MRWAADGHVELGRARGRCFGLIVFARTRCGLRFGFRIGIGDRAADQPGRALIDLSLFGGEAGELARFGGDEEVCIDRKGVGHPAPQPLDQHRTIALDGGLPFRLTIAAPKPFGAGGNRIRAGHSVNIGCESASQRQRFNHARIVFARDKAHQRTQPQRVFNQPLQLNPAARAACGFQDAPAGPRLDQIAIERGVVLEVNFRTPLGDLVQRRLGNEQVPGADDVRHLAVEECQQQRADMRAVNIGVGHDDDLVIAQLVEIELIADAGAHCLDQRADFL